MENRSYDDWVTVFKTGTDYEAELVRDRLRDAGIPAVIMNKRDHAYNLNFGDMAQIKVLVPAEKKEAATNLLNEPPLSDEELTRIALAADPFDEEAEEPADVEDPEEDQS